MRRQTRSLCCTLSLLAWASAAAAQTAPRQVLLLYSYEREFAPHLAFAKLFLPELSRTSIEPVDFIEVSLQPARVSQGAPDDAIVGHVQSMLAGRQPIWWCLSADRPLRQDPAALRTESSALWRVRDHGYHIHRS